MKNINTDMLVYEPETGKVFKKAASGVVEVGYIHTGGSGYKKQYMRARIEGVNVYLHRLAWLLFYGKSPEGEVDHINGNGLDNRIQNLRVVDRTKNRMNCRILDKNTSGQAGVRKRGRKWIAQITHKGRYKYLGTFSDFESARKARVDEQLRLGFSINHGTNKLGI